MKKSKHLSAERAKEFDVLPDIIYFFKIRKKQFKIALYDTDEENSYKPIKAKGAFSGNYIEYDSNGDRSENYSLAKYLQKIRRH